MKKDDIDYLKDEFVEMFPDKDNSFSEMLNFGMEVLFWADTEDITTIRDVTAMGREFKNKYIDLNCELEGGTELITPAGTMIVPTIREAWLKADAMDIFRDALDSGELVLDGENDRANKAALLDRIVTEFEFALGISNIILQLMRDKVLETDKTRLEVYFMMLRGVHYYKLLTDELVEVLNSGV